MILYHASRDRFLGDLEASRVDQLLVEAFRIKLRIGVSPSEIASWRNSLNYVGNVLRAPEFPPDLGVSVECQIPSTSKRIDVVLTGQGSAGSDHAVIVELKQWETVQRTECDGIVRTRLGLGERQVTHPSYQALSYARLLRQFNEAVHTGGIELHPCAFLHNCTQPGEVRDPFYAEYLAQAPVFLRHEISELRGFIREFIRTGDAGDIRGRIERSRLIPSRQLADAVAGMLDQNSEFTLVDEQKHVFETGLFLARKSAQRRKQVLIVEGGPGTGKSVVAVNLLARLTREGRFTQYVSKNSAPRAVYSEKLAGRRRKSEISGLFRGSGSYTDTSCDSHDCLIVDEAHRLNLKSGLFGNLGENQIKELISAARCSVFFLDEDQRVTLQDIGSKEEIRSWAGRLGAEVTEMQLESQFRCSGSNAFLAWLDYILGIRQTANTDLKGSGYDFQVVDCPRQLHDAIRARNVDNRARVVAGYCWDWVSKKPGKVSTPDIILPAADGSRYTAQWNLGSDGMLWIMNPGSVEQVGCIHTCQGLEVDHIGVLIGPDLCVEDGRLVANPAARSSGDKSIRGWKGQRKLNPAATDALTDRIIRNTYRTLMTRGMKSCHVYATDPALRQWLRDRM
jgi:hypothetical protein